MSTYKITNKLPIFTVFATSNRHNISPCGLYPILVQSQSNLEDKVERSAARTSCQVGWIDYVLQDILG